MTVRHPFTILLTTLALVALPGTAHAGEYVVHSCKLPDGRPAPVDGWRKTGSTPWGTWSSACATGGALSANLGAQPQQANTSFIGWTFETGGAPIRGYSVWRSGSATASGYNVSGLYYTADGSPAASSYVDYCATYLGCRVIGDYYSGRAEINRLTRSAAQIGLGSTSWTTAVGCGSAYTGSCSPLPGIAEVGSLAVHAASFTIGDDIAPTAGPVSGDLTQPGAGVGSIRFVAKDDWSGVYRASVEVDGVPVVAVTPNQNDGNCVRLGQAGDANDFVRVRPCPASQEVELALPAGSATAGSHSLRVRVFDAAGNAATAFGPAPMTVTPAQAAGVGSLATGRFVPDKPGTRSAQYGMTTRLSGVLLDRLGNPLSAAKVSVTMRAPAAKVRERVREIVTGADGRYAVSVPGTATRTVEFSHTASGASLAQRVAITSRIALRAVRAHVKPYGKLRLSGRLPSERARRGATAAIQVRRAGGWRTIAAPRVARSGSFKLAYKLRRTAHATFVFRALIRPSSDLTVTPKVSRAVRVRVG